MRVFLIVISFVLASCNGQKKAVMDDINTVNSKSENSLELLLQEEDSSFEVAETIIIKDVKRLRGFYSKINRTRKPGLQVPEIDFSKEMIVIQCGGFKNHKGLTVLSKLKETDTQIVLISEVKKVEGKPSIAVMTSPFSIYKMSLTQKEITFEKGIK